MQYTLFNWFVKLTAWPVQKIVFRTKILYEDKKVQGRSIKGPAIIISNHTSVFDFAILLFVFFGKTVRYLMAEVLFEKPGLSRFLRMLGGIKVDRNSHDFGFIVKCEEILKHGGGVGVFPESRIPRPEEERPLPFKPSAAYLALLSGVPVIPVYTNGRYFQKKRAVVIVGTPFYADSFADINRTDKENIVAVSDAMRERIISLGELLETYEQK